MIDPFGSRGQIQFVTGPMDSPQMLRCGIAKISAFAVASHQMDAAFDLQPILGMLSHDEFALLHDR